MKIMILEDNIEINRILCELFQNEGYEVASFYNAFDAIEAFKHERVANTESGPAPANILCVRSPA